MLQERLSKRYSAWGMSERNKSWEPKALEREREGRREGEREMLENDDRK